MILSYPVRHKIIVPRVSFCALPISNMEGRRFENETGLKFEDLLDTRNEFNVRIDWIILLLSYWIV